MSEIITFYSYKGGVGRTMALANASVVLSKWGHRVLVVDWDLEAPGLEHFYKDYIDVKQVETTSGVIDLLQLDGSNKWQDDVIRINIPLSNDPIHLISSGRRDEHYFKKVRSFDVDEFYEKDGGEIIEQLRNEWLANYDYVLIDSRTGITEIGGICTIQLPDTVVMLFTATNQGFDGVLDIIQRAGAAQQKLSYDRQKLIFLPIPSKFETNTEFKLSQEWLEIFAARLENTYNDWLPADVNRKDFLELTKIPYIAYFSFGEKLPVIEQGVKDPSGLGYAYETLAALIANHLHNVDSLFNNRDQYITEVNKYPSLEIETKRNGNGSEKRLKLLKQKLSISQEVVKVEKSKDVIIDCIQNNIIPLLEIISNQFKEFYGLFKYRNEVVNFISDRGNHEESNLSVPRLTIDVTNWLKNYSLKYLVVSYKFKDLRNSNKNETEFILKFIIEFHQIVFEIALEDLKMNVNKLYHESFTFEESEAIVNALSASLLEQIESTLNP